MNALLAAYRRAHQHAATQDRADQLLAACGPAPVRIQHFTSWDEFDTLSETEQTAVWRQLRTEQSRLTDGTADHQAAVHIPITKPQRPKRTWTPQPVTNGRALDDIPTDEYVHALTGEDIPIGRMARCPLPDHDDNSPSFKAYDNQTWVCYGCNRGGHIYNFAAALWGHTGSLRGDAFREVRDRLLTELGMT
jgi:predicted Fe-S protein YdhL (DUF1289 family)